MTQRGLSSFAVARAEDRGEDGRGTVQGLHPGRGVRDLAQEAEHHLPLQGGRGYGRKRPGQ